MAGAKAYEGDGITVYFEGRRCIHAGRCVKGLPAVFDPNRRPWINPTEGAADRIAAVVQQCPSGALSYERTDGGAPEPLGEVEPTITLVRDGPMYVRGMIDLKNTAGETLTAGPRVALCRCGLSKNKPFCDNSHIDGGFTDP